jgi:lipopolysaccharide export system protein LptA
VATSGANRVNFRPLKLITALRVVIAALLVAFGVVLFLSFGKKEEDAVRIQLASPPPPPGEQVVDLSENFAITGTKGGRESFRLQAEQVTGFVGDKKQLRGVRLEVVGEDGERLSLSGATGQFDMADKRAQLAGEVKVEGKNGFMLTAPSLYFDGDRDMLFTPDEIAFESRGLKGTGRGLNYLTRGRSFKIPAEVHVSIEPSEPGGQEVEITSSDMSISLDENDVVFNESVHLVRGEESFSGNYLKLTLDQDRKKMVAVKAFGQVQAKVLSGKQATPATLQADSLLAGFLPDGRSLDKVEAHGGCKLESQGVQGTGETIVAEVLQDRIALRGDPVVLDSRSRITGQEIDLFPGSRGLEVRGEVKTSFQPGRSPSNSSGSYFSVEDGGDIARFSGGVRGWQGDDSLQAEEVILRFAEKGMRAYRNVFCRFTAQPGGEAPAASSPPTLIVASAMEYSEAEGVVHFREAVKLTRQSSTVLSDRMHVTLSDPSLGRRKVLRVLAEGGVRFTHLTNSGKSDRLVFIPDQDLAEMQQDAGLAEVVDHTNGRTLRGKMLRFDMKGNRVLTETYDGGRTWITLNPKEKDTPALEPKIGH